MGTTVTLDVRDEALTRPDMFRAVDEAVSSLHRVDDVLSTWKAMSPLSRLRRAAIRLQDCPPEVDTVLAECISANKLTRGWFDPFAMPGGFDPTGLVKGWAAREALRVMAAHGVGHALVNAGGDLVVAGNASGRADGAGWAIGVVDPIAPGEILAIVHGTDLAVATSGSYERGPLAVDPRSGLRVQRLLSATVVARDPAAADACATAATAHGPAALDWLEHLPGTAAMLVAMDGTRLCTSSWPHPATLRE